MFSLRLVKIILSNVKSWIQIIFDLSTSIHCWKNVIRIFFIFNLLYFILVLGAIYQVRDYIVDIYKFETHKNITTIKTEKSNPEIIVKQIDNGSLISKLLTLLATITNSNIILPAFQYQHDMQNLTLNVFAKTLSSLEDYLDALYENLPQELEITNVVFINSQITSLDISRKKTQRTQSKMSYAQRMLARLSNTSSQKSQQQSTTGTIDSNHYQNSKKYSYHIQINFKIV